jgi:hypothetical protein
MKNLSILFVITWLALSCAKDGEMGPKGLTGSDGQTGAKGPTGDKGPIGNTGSQGDPGKNVFTTAYFTDWVSVDNFKFSEENNLTVTYSSIQNIVLAFIPKPQNASITFEPYLTEFYLYDKVTQNLLGTLYAYYSFIGSDGNRIIFRNSYKDNEKAYTIYGLGYFVKEGNQILPSVIETNSLIYNKSAFPANTNFSEVGNKLNPKKRFIFIPVGLPQQGGRLKKLENYEDFLDAYNIPENGSSKLN